MDKCKTGLRYNVVPPPYTGNFMPTKSDLVYPSLDDFVDVNESVVEKPTVETNEPETTRKENGAPIIKDWESDSDEENVPKQVKSPRKTSVDKNRQNTPSPRGNKRNWNQQMSQKLGSDFKMFNKACHVCGSFDHLKNDCNNWSGLISLNTARPVNTVQSRTAVNNAGPMKNVINNAYSTARRPFNKITAANNSNFTKKGTRVNTARPKAVLSVVKGNKGNVVKASACWVWRPKHKVLDHGNPQQDLKDKGVIDKRMLLGKARMGDSTWHRFILLTSVACLIFYSSQSLKDSPNAGSKPSGEEEKKDTEDPKNENSEAPSTEESRVNQEKDASVNSTNTINTITDEEVLEQRLHKKIGCIYVCLVLFQLPEFKDHPVEQIIGDIHSAPQTKRMTKNVTEHAMFSSVQQRTNHKDFQNCLFACFLSQEEPKKMDVKSDFLYGKIEEEVYVCQPLGFEDQDFPDRVCKVEKALYGLHQAPRTWYETLSTYLLDNGFQRGKIDKTLFIRRDKVIFSLVMSKQQAQTPMETHKPLLKDADGEDVDEHLYRSMIGSLMYLTSSRPDIMFAVCA
ncbi:putative ribonuclease H-like domain-containing protein [Tanacetum coccineum]